MKKLLYIFCLLALKLGAQTISPSVINSAGKSQSVTISGSNYIIASNIGEPIITTVSNGSNTVTQGFLQPEILGEGGLSITPFVAGISCSKKTDGKITLINNTQHAIAGTAADTAYYLYKLYPSLPCSPSYSCSTFTDLAAGTYTLIIEKIWDHSSVANYTLTQTFIVADSNIECDSLGIYNAFSPDGNGMNDLWIIDRIDNTENMDNHVTIYNRWGGLIKQFQNYNNTSSVWKGETKDNPNSVVPNGTYFYVIEIKGKAPKKGWVEVMGK